MGTDSQITQVNTFTKFIIKEMVEGAEYKSTLTEKNLNHVGFICYNAFNVYRRELAPGTVSLTGDRAQGDDSKHWAYSTSIWNHRMLTCFKRKTESG